MKGPPALSLPLGSGRLERAVGATFWSGAATCLAVWLMAWVAMDFSWSLAMVAAMLGACVGWGVARPLCGTLVWDGQAWWLQRLSEIHPHPLQRLRISMDLGSLAMLRADGAAWCLVTRGMAGAQWHALQLALRLGPLTPASSGGVYRDPGAFP